MLVIKDRLYKNSGEYIDLNIVSNNDFSDNTRLKTQVHQTIGDYDIFEWIGEGATSIKMQLYFANEEEFVFFKQFAYGTQMTLVRQNFRNVIINLTSDLSPSYTYFGNYTVNVEFTTARDPSQTTDFDINIFSYNVGSKKTLFDKLQITSEKIFSFVGNINEKIGVFTNSIELATSLINNITQALTSSQSILTTPLNTIQRSSANIVQAISTINQSLNNISFIISTTPSNIGSIFTGIVSATESLFEVFSSDIQDEQLTVNANFGCDVINTIYNADFNDDIYGSSQNVTILKEQNDMLKILFLCGLIANLEEKISEINSVSLLNLTYYKTTFEKAYLYIISSDIIDPDLRQQTELCKIRFFRTYNNLYAKATKVIEVNVEIPTSLHSIVYNVNGNLDFFNETMQLNNIVNVGFVSGKILVLSND